MWLNFNYVKSNSPRNIILLWLLKHPCINQLSSLHKLKCDWNKMSCMYNLWQESRTTEDWIVRLNFSRNLVYAGLLEAKKNFIINSEAEDKYRSINTSMGILIKFI